MVFLLCSLIGLIVCFILFILLPNDITTVPKQEDPKASPPPNNIFNRIVKILTNMSFLCLILSSTMTYILLNALSNWAGLYMKECFSYEGSIDGSSAVRINTWVEFGGLVGGLGSGILSDRLGGRRAMSAFIISVNSIYYTFIRLFYLFDF